MSQTTGNSQAFIEAQQYSDFILRNLHDGLLPTTLYRNVSDFGEGTTLNIKTIGSATIQEITENEDLTYNPIDTGTVQLQITDYVGDAWYVTDVLRQDGAQVEALSAETDSRLLSSGRFHSALRPGRCCAANRPCWLSRIQLPRNR